MKICKTYFFEKYEPTKLPIGKFVAFRMLKCQLKVFSTRFDTWSGDDI